MRTVLWKPQPGPQTTFLTCPFEEVLYGGSAGGGKTDALLGDFISGIEQYGAAWHGLIARRSFPMLREIEKRALEILAPHYGADCYKRGEKIWRIPTPKGECSLKLASIDDAIKVIDHQGQQYTVHKSTVVNTLRGPVPIPSVVVGDMVLTLDGPREVLVVHGPYVKAGVKMVVSSGGEELGYQIQGEHHSVLTGSGWLSASGCRFPGISFSRSQGSCLGSPHSSSGRRRPSSPCQSLLARCGASPCPSSLRSVGGTSCACSDLETTGAPQCDCLFCRFLRGEQLLDRRVTVQASLPLPAGVASPSRSDLPLGGRGSAPAHSPPSGFGYEHPYTGRPAEWTGDCADLTLDFFPVGDQVMYDLTVADNAQYATLCHVDGQVTVGGDARSPVPLINCNSWVGLDEATQWPDDSVLEYLITRTRSPKGSPTYFRLTANPGGVGHAWVKDRFRIGVVPEMEPFKVEGRVRDGETHDITRVFIPAKVTDNQILMQNDPTYIDKLNNISDPILRKALYEGDWDIVAGAAFPEFSLENHVCEPFEIPQGSRVIRMMDWGFVKPYAVLWQYVNFDGRTYVLRELYGQGPRTGEGSRENPEEVIEKIWNIEREMGWNVTQAFLDPQCWAEHGGDSEYDLLGGPKGRWQPWPKGPGSRRQHKQLVHEMLKVVNGESRVQIFKHCHHLIRTLGTLPIDQRNPEVVDTDSEDHMYDAFRGGNATRAKFNRFGRAGRELEFFDNLLTPTAQSGRGRNFGGW